MSERESSAGRTSSPAATAAVRVSIPGYWTGATDGVIYYFVRVEETGGYTSVLQKRYAKFDELRSKLLEFVAADVPALPGKAYKFMTDHTDSKFLENRKVRLEIFLQRCLSHPRISKSRAFRGFLATDIVENPPKAYLDPMSPDEKKLASPTKGLEDAEVTEISIPATKQMSDHTLFQIMCANGVKEARTEMNEWVALKRYNDFAVMDTQVRKDLKDSGKLDVLLRIPELPSRANKFFTDHSELSFIEERRVMLESYLKQMIKFREVLENPAFLKFVSLK